MAKQQTEVNGKTKAKRKVPKPSKGLGKTLHLSKNIYINLNSNSKLSKTIEKIQQGINGFVNRMLRPLYLKMMTPLR